MQQIAIDNSLAEQYIETLLDLVVSLPLPKINPLYLECLQPNLPLVRETFTRPWRRLYPLGKTVNIVKPLMVL